LIGITPLHDISWEYGRLKILHNEGHNQAADRWQFQVSKMK
jgi:hypothetical protein